MLTFLVSLIPHHRHTWQWQQDPRYYIHTSQWLCVHRGPSTMFLNWHIGKESLSWYLSRQPVIIAHLCLLIVWSFPAVQAQVGGLWFQARGRLSWPWDTRELQPQPHGSGMLWLLIRLSMARSLRIGPGKAFSDWGPEPQARWFTVEYRLTAVALQKLNTNAIFLNLDRFFMMELKEYEHKYWSNCSQTES